jgi:hypothetical protein
VTFSHGARGLEVDQDVGAVEALLDRVLQGVRRVVGLLEQGVTAEPDAS